MEEKIAYKPSNIELKENGEFIINDEGIKELQEGILKNIDQATFEKALIDIFLELIKEFNADVKNVEKVISNIAILNTYLPIYQKMINLSEQEIENETIKSYGGLYMLLEAFKKANSEEEKVSETEDE
jgi:hypothetical protein